MRSTQQALEVMFSRVGDRDLCNIIWNALDGQKTTTDTQRLFRDLWIPEFYFVLEGLQWVDLIEEGEEFVLDNPEDYLGGIRSFVASPAYQRANELPRIFACDGDNFALISRFLDSRMKESAQWAAVCDAIYIQLELAVCITNGLATCVRQSPMDFVDKIDRIFATAAAEGVFLGDIFTSDSEDIESSWGGAESRIYKGVVSYVEEATKLNEHLIERTATIQEVYHLLVAMCSDLPESSAGVVLSDLGNDVDRIVGEVEEHWELKDTARCMRVLMERWSVASLSGGTVLQLFEQSTKEHEELASAMQRERFVERYAVLIRDLGRL